MKNLNEWTAREMDIYVKQHDGKAWLTVATLEHAQQLIDLIGKSKVELRRGKFFNGVALVDVYLKGYTYC